MQLLQASGCHVNPEPWSGRHLGISIALSSVHRGTRSTAADLLSCLPSNLEVKTDCRVYRVLFKEKRAFALTLVGRDDLFHASKEIILCAGTLGTPEILLRSGIGPAERLREVGIEVVHDNQNLGRNYRDYCYVCI